MTDDWRHGTVECYLLAMPRCRCAACVDEWNRYLTNHQTGRHRTAEDISGKLHDATAGRR
ncbi:MAG: hypothetical protein ACRERD_27540 [Candidatus Binatia bacterium]